MEQLWNECVAAGLTNVPYTDRYHNFFSQEFLQSYLKNYKTSNNQQTLKMEFRFLYLKGIIAQCSANNQSCIISFLNGISVCFSDKINTINNGVIITYADMVTSLVSRSIYSKYRFPFILTLGEMNYILSSIGYGDYYNISEMKLIDKMNIIDWYYMNLDINKMFKLTKGYFMIT